MGLLTEDGCFTGGRCPYGYSFVKTGRMNKRRQEVNDLVICEPEAEVVRTMFQLAAKGGYGRSVLPIISMSAVSKTTLGRTGTPRLFKECCETFCTLVF